MSGGTGKPAPMPKGGGAETLHLKLPAPRLYSTRPKIMKETMSAMLIACALATLAQADDLLIGTWVKQRTQQEDHAYSGDTNWSLTVTFEASGQFRCKSVRVEGTNTVDESVKGTYSADRGLIAYTFDNPTDAASNRLAEWFAFWQLKSTGVQTFRYDGESLVLGNDGRKLWVHMKRKTVEQQGRGYSPPASRPWKPTL